jgi:hypothetical protein
MAIVLVVCLTAMAPGPWRAGGDDDVDLEARQLGRKLRQALELPAAESVLD